MLVHRMVKDIKNSKVLGFYRRLWSLIMQDQ